MLISVGPDADRHGNSLIGLIWEGHPSVPIHSLGRDSSSYAARMHQVRFVRISRKLRFDVGLRRGGEVLEGREPRAEVQVLTARGAVCGGTDAYLKSAAAITSRARKAGTTIGGTSHSRSFEVDGLVVSSFGIWR